MNRGSRRPSGCRSGGVRLHAAAATSDQGKVAAGRMAKKYQKGPSRRSSSVVNRRKVSVTSAYSRKPGIRRAMATTQGEITATNRSTPTGSHMMRP